MNPCTDKCYYSFVHCFLRCYFYIPQWLLSMCCNSAISSCHTFSLFLEFILFIYSWLHWVFVAACGLAGFLQLWRAGATLHCGAWASHCGGFSCCRARALGAWAQQLQLAGSRVQAQQLWCVGLAAPWHVGSSRTRAQTCVPCIGRRILNHCATREALFFLFFSIYLFGWTGSQLRQMGSSLQPAGFFVCLFWLRHVDSQLRYVVSSSPTRD